MSETLRCELCGCDEDLLDRIAALETQVRDMEKALLGHDALHRAKVFGESGTAGATQARPKDNDGNAPKVPCDYPHCETPCERPCDKSHLVDD